MVNQRYSRFCVVLFILFSGAALAKDAYLLNGLDSKVKFSSPGKLEFVEPGQDLINIVDISDPESPKSVANLPLSNSLFGPPTNLQVTPDESIGLVTSAVKWENVEGKWKPTPDNKLFVIALKGEKSTLIDTLEVGLQPSGLSISSDGSFALIANRAGKSVSVVKIDGQVVKLHANIDVGDEVAAVAITPDMSKALIVKNKSNKIGVIDINDMTFAYQKDADMSVADFPYNIDITPDGSIAIVAHTGNGGRSDGNTDALVVIDISSSNPPHVSGYFSAGDAPEAFAISPQGNIVVALLLGGDTILPETHWAHSNPGQIAVFEIHGKELKKNQSVDIAGLPEGVAFSRDGRFMYVSSFMEKKMYVYKVEGNLIRETGVALDLPGHPASMRGSAH
ncbi:MAG: YncE family protein [Betaproteobacteria bacterium]